MPPTGIICGWTLTLPAFISPPFSISFLPTPISLSLFLAITQLKYLCILVWHQIDSHWHSWKQADVRIHLSKLFCSQHDETHYEHEHEHKHHAWYDCMYVSMWSRHLWHQYIGVEQFTMNEKSERKKKFVAALLYDVMLEYFIQTRRDSLESM